MILDPFFPFLFFTEADRLIYLEWLEQYCQKYAVDILAYCLMTNHVHLILRPSNEDGLQKVLKPLHMRYAQHINKIKRWSGHLWQGRFFSSALDEHYTWSSICYVERNPVRAKTVQNAEDYDWSSAAAHCGLKKDSLLYDWSSMDRIISEKEWSKWLAITDKENEMTILRRNIEKGLPCGDDVFVNQLEKLSGKQLRYRPQGRPFKG